MRSWSIGAGVNELPPLPPSPVIPLLTFGVMGAFILAVLVAAGPRVSQVPTETPRPEHQPTLQVEGEMGYTSSRYTTQWINHASLRSSR